jgi:hypothetical protein
VSLIRDLNRLQAEIDKDILETVKAVVPREALRKMLDIMESMNAGLERVKQKTERRTGFIALFRR